MPLTRGGFGSIYIYISWALDRLGFQKHLPINPGKKKFNHLVISNATASGDHIYRSANFDFQYSSLNFVNLFYIWWCQGGNFLLGGYFLTRQYICQSIQEKTLNHLVISNETASGDHIHDSLCWVERRKKSHGDTSTQKDCYREKV